MACRRSQDLFAEAEDWSKYLERLRSLGRSLSKAEASKAPVASAKAKAKTAGAPQGAQKRSSTPPPRKVEKRE